VTGLIGGDMTSRTAYPAIIECRNCGERIGTALEKRSDPLGGSEPAVIKCPACGHLNHVKQSSAEDQTRLKGEEMFVKRI
jgi:DNA-directed RNA polymerase subunit RPC12/RpoP